MARRHGKVAGRPDEGTAEAVAADGAGPRRTCIVTRREGAPEDLIRFVLDPAGVVVPDIARRLPGRGVWVTLDRRSVADAVVRKAFNRAFRREVAVPADLAARVEELLARRAGEALSLANKAGLVATGFESVHRGAESEDVICVVHASDAAADGTAKIDRKYRAVCRDDGREPLILTTLTIDQLSLAIGRSPVVHALVGTGRAGDNFVRATGRLIRYRSGAVLPFGNSEASSGSDEASMDSDEAGTGVDREAAIAHPSVGE